MYILLGVNIICMSINPSRPTITCRSVYHVFRAIALYLQFLIIGADYWRYRLPMDTVTLAVSHPHSNHIVKLPDTFLYWSKTLEFAAQFILFSVFFVIIQKL